jgi:hypothetical protein
MFKKFFERAAAKASLVNIKFDLDNLGRAFPHNVSATSKALFSLLENITLAFSNNASEAEVQQVIAAKSETNPDVLKEILDHLFRLILASSRGDTTAVNRHDERINELFRSATGTPVDVTRTSWFAKLAMRSSQ